jgi:hypothetical protein
MQFLVYLTVLMVSISTVLLEVHWLTSPAPQPRPVVQAANVSAQPRKVEGPTAALSPVYPKTAETTPAAPTDAQQQPQASTNTASAPAAVATNFEPLKPPVETTGVAARTEDTRDPATTFVAPVQAAALNNRCDVQACSSAYQSFRAADCTYQPFEGARRICEKPPVQRTTAREQTERPERRQLSRDVTPLSRDVTPRDSERTIGRRVYDDPDEGDAQVDDESDRISLFSVFRPRW